MKRKFLSLALLFAALAAGRVGWAEEAAKPPLVTLTMKDVPVNVMLELISESTGIPIQVDGLGPNLPLVTLDVKEAPLQDVLRMLARTANLNILPKPDGSYRLFSASTSPPTSAPTSSAEPAASSVADLPENLTDLAYLEVTDAPLADALQQLVDSVADAQNRAMEAWVQQAEEKNRLLKERYEQGLLSVEEYQTSLQKVPRQVWKVVIDPSVPPGLTVTARIKAVPLRKALAMVLDQAHLRAACSFVFAPNEQVYTLIVTPPPTVTVTSPQTSPPAQGPPVPGGISLSNLRATPVLLNNAPALLISADLSVAATVDVRIFSVKAVDAIGREPEVVRQVVTNWAAPAGPLHVVWDECDAAGKRVPAGVHFCEVEARNAERGMVRATKIMRVGEGGSIATPGPLRVETKWPLPETPAQLGEATQVWKRIPLKYVTPSDLVKRLGGGLVGDSAALHGKDASEAWIAVMRGSELANAKLGIELTNAKLGIELLIGDDSQNSLIVQGTLEGIAELEELISLLDIRPIEVEIQAHFVLLPPDAAGSLNITWAVPGEMPGGPKVRYQCAVGNFLPALESLLNEKRARLLGAPTLVVQSGQEAGLVVGGEPPEEEWGLMVRPRVTGMPPNESITLSIRSATIKEGEAVPLPDRPAPTLRIKNNDTIALAGVWETPPGADGELIVFVTARVVHTENTSS